MKTGPSLTPGQRLRITSLACLALLAGSGCKKEGPAPGTPEGQSTSSQPAASEPPAGAEQAPLTAESLKPRLSEVGSPAEAIQIQMQRVVFAPGDVGKEPPGRTVLSITPPVPGALRISSTSQLGFTPEKGFVPNTRYRVRLESVETPEGVLEPPSADAWSFSFSTPELGLVRMSQQSVDVRRGTLYVDLVFSAAVDASAVKALGSWFIDGSAATPVSLSNAQPNVVRVLLHPGAIRAQSSVRFVLSAGLPAAAFRTVTAPAAEASLRVELGLPFTIQDVSLQEGPTGYFIAVICNDSASGGEQYYYDRARYRGWYTSAQCILDATSAREAVHVTPAAELEVVPSSHGFRILGDWHQGAYALRIDAGARTVDGGVLTGTYEWKFTVPQRSPKVSFVAEGRYLPRGGWSRLAVRHLNVSEAYLTVRRIPFENLVFWLNQGAETATPAVSDLVVDRRRIALSDPVDETATTWIDVAALMPREQRGLYELTLSSGSASDVRRLLLTDMSLVAKRSAPPPGEPWRQEVQVWALGMDTGEPLSGVEVRLVRPSGHALATCTTGGQAGCQLEVAARDVDPMPPFAIIATRGDDLTYIKLDELKDEISDAAVAGEPYASDAVYRAAIYSDRGVYRPGETAHLVAVLRDRGFVAPAGMPVIASLFDPRDKEVKRSLLETNGAGLVSLDVPFAAFAPTGRYRWQVTAADKPVGQYDFQVEEFVPERMKVEVGFAEPAYARGEEVSADIHARYLFGGVPARTKVELTCELQPTRFAPRQNADFRYGVWTPDNERPQPVVLGKQESTLDDKGEATVACAGEAGGARLDGPAQLAASAAVFEAGSGRTTVGRASVAVHPERYYLGLKSSVDKVAAGKAFTVQGAVVDWNGVLATGARGVAEVTVELYRLEQEYTYYYDDEAGEGGSRVLTRPVLSGSEKVAVEGGKFSITLTPTEDAVAFLVRATAGRARTDLKLEGHGSYYAWQPAESRVDRTPRPARATWLDVQAPAEIEVGAPVTVDLEAPYRGQMLFTVETNHLVQSAWVPVQGGKVSWQFTLDAFAPNVYVAAFLVKDPHLESQEAYLPDRAFGVRSVKVMPSENTQKLALIVPKEVRSNSPLTVELRLDPTDEPAFATVAAVDEGILSLTNFQSPDPVTTLFARRALGVETFETVGWALNLPAGGPSSSTGGDEEEQGAAQPGRVQPIKPVALWSGVLPVGKDGRVSVTFQVPLYRGKLRVMAVSAGKRRTGAAAADVVVRDPLVVQTTMPRFLSCGDEIQIPVFVTNLSGARQKVTVALGAEMLPVPGLDQLLAEPSPVELTGAREKTLSLENGAAGTVVFQARATRQLGAAKVKIVARAGKLESRDEAEVPLLPAGPKERVVQRIELEAGRTDLKPYLTGWMPTTESSTLWVTRNPYGEAFDHLTYLLHYPYG